MHELLQADISFLYLQVSYAGNAAIIVVECEKFMGILGERTENCSNSELAMAPGPAANSVKSGFCRQFHLHTGA